MLDPLEDQRGGHCGWRTMGEGRQAGEEVREEQGLVTQGLRPRKDI